MEDDNKARWALSDSRLDRLERTQESVAASLVTLTRIQVQNEEIARTVVANTEAIRKINEEMPILRLISRIAVTGVFSLVGTIALIVLKSAGIVFK